MKVIGVFGRIDKWTVNLSIICLFLSMFGTVLFNYKFDEL